MERRKNPKENDTYINTTTGRIYVFLDGEWKIDLREEPEFLDYGKGFRYADALWKGRIDRLKKRIETEIDFSKQGQILSIINKELN